MLEIGSGDVEVTVSAGIEEALVCSALRWHRWCGLARVLGCSDAVESPHTEEMMLNVARNGVLRTDPFTVAAGSVEECATSLSRAWRRMLEQCAATFERAETFCLLYADDAGALIVEEALDVAAA